MVVAFRFFTQASAVHFDRYPLYGLVLVLGLFFELLSRDRGKTSALQFRTDIFDQHAVSVRQTLFVAGTLFLYLAAAKDAFISRIVLLILIPLLHLLLFGSNCFLPRLLARRVFGENRIGRALLIGSPRDAHRLRSWLSEKEAFGFRAIGIIGSRSEPELTGLPWLGERSDLERVLHQEQVTQVVLLELPASPEEHEQLVDTLDNHGARLLILSNLEEKLRHRVVHFEDGGLEFISPRTEPLEDPLNRGLKRLLDLAIAVPVTVIALPPLAAIVWLLHRLQSPGPLFYRQVRAGIQNRQFVIVKFRTMHANNPEESRQASPGDARVFSAGHWIRRMSLDEVPQFWNVITSEMSVCGPRPHLLAHNADFARKMRRYHLRASVKPGVTGLAQVRGFRGEIKSSSDIEQRLESDIAYFENWRLSFDLAIIFRTGLQILLFACNGLLRPRKRTVAGAREGAHVTSREFDSEITARTYIPAAVRRNFRQILGIRFFTGTAEEAVAIGLEGGLVVAPSAPVLLGLEDDPIQRAAIRGSALAITDSGLMVLLWQLLTGEKATRVSGLRYLELLLNQPQLRAPGATFWVMPSPEAMTHNLAWLQKRGLSVSPADCYLAPEYSRSVGDRITDLALLELIRERRPAHVIMAIGGGIQEKLGAELLALLDYRPAVHCTGGAIGMLTGEQARIPGWADRLCLGWLFRCFDDPARFIPRYWEARNLVSLMLHYHGRLPDAPTPIKSPVTGTTAEARC